MAADDPPPKTSLFILGGFVALVAVGALLLPRGGGQSSETTAPSAEGGSEQIAPPPSLSDRVRTIARAAIDDNYLVDAAYEGVDVKPYDDPNANAPQSTSMWEPVIVKAPKGALDVTIMYHLPHIPDSDEDEAKFAGPLFQKVFAIGPSLWLVSIMFLGPSTDRYGRTTEVTYLAYGMSRDTFQKIDWRGFNVAGLCKFLMDEGNDELAADGQPKGDDVCDLDRSTSSLGIPGPR